MIAPFCFIVIKIHLYIKYLFVKQFTTISTFKYFRHEKEKAFFLHI